MLKKTLVLLCTFVVVAIATSTEENPVKDQQLQADKTALGASAVGEPANKQPLPADGPIQGTREKKPSRSHNRHVVINYGPRPKYEDKGVAPRRYGYGRRGRGYDRSGYRRRLDRNRRYGRHGLRRWKSGRRWHGRQGYRRRLSRRERYRRPKIGSLSRRILLQRLRQRRLLRSRKRLYHRRGYSRRLNRRRRILCRLRRRRLLRRLRYGKGLYRRRGYGRRLSSSRHHSRMLRRLRYRLRILRRLRRRRLLGRLGYGRRLYRRRGYGQRKYRLQEYSRRWEHGRRWGHRSYRRNAYIRRYPIQAMRYRSYSTSKYAPQVK